MHMRNQFLLEVKQNERWRQDHLLENITPH